MDSLDTNVLVRYYMDDEPAQADIAETLLRSGKPLFVTATVILELVWVLQKTAYRLSRARIMEILRHLLTLPNVEVEHEARVMAALRGYESGLDFADALHLAGSGHCRRMLTFDGPFSEGARRLGLAPACELVGQQAS